MLTMSDKAGAYLAQMIQEAETSAEGCARLVRRGDALGLDFGQQENSDQAYEHDGKVVLVVEEPLAAELDGRTLDLEESPQGEAPKLALV